MEFLLHCLVFILYVSLFLWKYLIIGIVQTSDWPDAPFTFCELYKERTKSYESKFSWSFIDLTHRPALHSPNRAGLNSPNSCQCRYPVSDRLRMREAILEMHRTDCRSFYSLFCRIPFAQLFCELRIRQWKCDADKKCPYYNRGEKLCRFI